MPTLSKLDSGLGEVKEELQEQIDDAKKFVRPTDDATRQTIAKLCMIGYFIGLVIILVGVPAYNYIAWGRADQRLLLDLKDTLLTYQAVIGTLVGAVVAYYFKTQLDKTDK